MWWLSDVKLSSDACCARVAIVCCRVEMVSDLGMSGIVPLRRSAIRRPLPSTGSWRVSSPASSVLWAAPTPCHPSRRTSLPSLGDTAVCTRLFAPVDSRVLLPQARGFGSTGFPSFRFIARRRQGLPGSWGTPLCTCPAL